MSRSWRSTATSRRSRVSSAASGFCWLAGKGLLRTGRVLAHPGPKGIDVQPQVP
jgi:hypothetical protein